MAHPHAEQEALFQRGIEAYGRGLYFEAHELWEEIWRDEDDEDRRRFVQGLILVAASMHKLFKMESAVGAKRLLGRAEDKLRGAKAEVAGLLVGELRVAIGRAKEAIEKLEAEGRTDLDPALIPQMNRVNQKA